MRFIFLSIVAVIAIVAGVIALKFSSQEPAPAPVVQQESTPKSETLKTSEVLVAKEPIALGTVITEGMVDIQPWPEHLVLGGFILSGAGSADVIGKVARAPLQAHEPFIKSKLANPNDPGFLAAALPPGMRAITIATDAVSGVAGFVFPGDRVDVLFTHNIPREVDGGGGGGRASIVEVIAPNVRVLAVNLREVTRPDGSSAPIASSAPSSVTVEISDEYAQRIRLSEKLGSLSLSLRSIKDNNTTIPNPTRVTDLTQIGAFSKSSGLPGDDGSIRVVRGGGNHGGPITVVKEGGGAYSVNPALLAPGANTAVGGSESNNSN